MNESSTCATVTPWTQPMSIEEKRRWLAKWIEDLEPRKKDLMVSYIDFVVKKAKNDSITNL